MRTAVRNTRHDIDSTMSITPQENCATEFVPENARHALNEKGDRSRATWGPHSCDTTRGVSTRNHRVESRERDPNVSGVNLTSKDKKVESHMACKEQKGP